MITVQNHEKTPIKIENNFFQFTYTVTNLFISLIKNPIYLEICFINILNNFAPMPRFIFYFLFLFSPIANLHGRGLCTFWIIRQVFNDKQIYQRL